MTLDQFKGLRSGQILYESGSNNADGTSRRWKVNGKMQGSLRTGSARFPLKHGLRTFGYVDLNNKVFLYLTENEAKGLPS